MSSSLVHRYGLFGERTTVNFVVEDGRYLNLKMEAVCFSEMLVTIYRTPRCYIPGENYLNTCFYFAQVPF